jgi:hypothetical protein
MTVYTHDSIVFADCSVIVEQRTVASHACHSVYTPIMWFLYTQISSYVKGAGTHSSCNLLSACTIQRLVKKKRVISIKCTAYVAFHVHKFTMAQASNNRGLNLVSGVPLSKIVHVRALRSSLYESAIIMHEPFSI